MKKNPSISFLVDLMREQGSTIRLLAYQYLVLSSKINEN
jgi:hypothetical protein